VKDFVLDLSTKLHNLNLLFVDVVDDLAKVVLVDFQWPFLDFGDPWRSNCDR
jgi:hypothetical protein